MKNNSSKFNQQYSGTRLIQARSTPAALALGILSAVSGMLPVQSVQARESDTLLEEVIITARKREESLQKTPVVVNVLTADAISAQRIEGIKDLGTVVPGLVTTETAASTAGNIYLRGVGTGALSPLFDQAVSINVDGVGISSAALMNAGMFDLDRIEVLRGPQALFFGKNSPGGVVALHTKDPTDEFELELTAMYEFEGEEPSLRAVVSGPLTETLGGRLSVGWSESDNHRFDVYNSDVFEEGPGGDPVQTAFATGKNPVQTEKLYAMGTLLWQPTNNLSAKLKYAHLEDNQEGHTLFNFQRTQCPNGPQVVYPVPGVDNCKMDGKVVAPGVSPLITAGDPNYPGYEGVGFADNEENFMSIEVNYEISDALELTSVTGYYDSAGERIGGSSFQVVSALINSVLSDIEQWGQELRLTSNYDGALNFALGAYYEERDIQQQNAVTLGSNFAGLAVADFGVFPIPIGQQFSGQDSTAYSVFGQLNWDFHDQWTLSAGARYSYEEKEGAIDVNHFEVAENGGPKISVPLLEEKPDWSNVSPEVTLSYRYSEEVMFFASYKTGFKSGGFDAAWKPGTLLSNNVLTGTPYDNVYDEEEAEGFELGVKSTLLEGTLRLNATLYSYEYDGLQLSKLSIGESGVPSIRVQNAASATVEGLELETIWLAPVDGLTLTANIALNSAEYDDYIADCFTGQTIAMGCNLNPDPVSGNFTGADMSGESLPNASDVSAAFALDYRAQVLGSWTLGLNVTTSFKDDYNPSSTLYPESWWQESYWLTNASASLTSSDDKWEFFLRGINLGNEYYSATGSDAPFSGNADFTGTADSSGLPDFFQFVNGGRQFMLGVTYRM